MSVFRNPVDVFMESSLEEKKSTRHRKRGRDRGTRVPGAASRVLLANHSGRPVHECPSTRDSQCGSRGCAGIEDRRARGEGKGWTQIPASDARIQAEHLASHRRLNHCHRKESERAIMARIDAGHTSDPSPAYLVQSPSLPPSLSPSLLLSCAHSGASGSGRRGQQQTKQRSVISSKIHAPRASGDGEAIIFAAATHALRYTTAAARVLQQGCD